MMIWMSCGGVYSLADEMSEQLRVSMGCVDMSVWVCELCNDVRIRNRVQCGISEISNK